MNNSQLFHKLLRSIKIIASINHLHWYFTLHTHHCLIFRIRPSSYHVHTHRIHIKSNSFNLLVQSTVKQKIIFKLRVLSSRLKISDCLLCNQSSMIRSRNKACDPSSKWRSKPLQKSIFSFILILLLIRILRSPNIRNNLKINTRILLVERLDVRWNFFPLRVRY